MKNSPTKHTLKFQAMPMQEMRILLEEDLLKFGYSSFITNMSENDLALKVVKNSQKPTIVSLTRHRHRPLEIELMVDHSLLNNYDLITKRGKVNNASPQNSWMLYRWIFLGFFLIGIIISALLFIVDVIVNMIEQITPGWTSLQRSYGILGVSLFILLWYIYGRPIMEKSERKKRTEMDYHLAERIKHFLSVTAYHAPIKSIIRCWNCFEEITRSEDFCPNCGERQN